MLPNPAGCGSRQQLQGCYEPRNDVQKEQLISSKQLISVVNDWRTTADFVTDNFFVFGKQIL